MARARGQPVFAAPHLPRTRGQGGGGGLLWDSASGLKESVDRINRDHNEQQGGDPNDADAFLEAVTAMRAGFGGIRNGLLAGRAIVKSAHFALIRADSSLPTQALATMSDQNPASYRPSAFYWRKKIRAARTVGELKEVGLALVAELEDHKACIRELGYIPPKDRVTEEEALAKRRPQ